MEQLSEISLDSELMEIQNLRQLLRKTKMQEQQNSQVYSPISSKELFQSEMDTILSEQEPKLIYSEGNDSWKESKNERMLEEVKKKLHRAKTLLNEMQSDREKSSTLTGRGVREEEEEESLENTTHLQTSNPKLSHVETTAKRSHYEQVGKDSHSNHHRLVHPRKGVIENNHKHSITAEPEYNHSANFQWFQNISSELTNAVHLLKKLYKQRNNSKAICQLESKMDQIWSLLNTQSLQHEDGNNCNWFRAYQELKEEHEEVVQQLQETYDSFRTLQEEHYQLEHQHQDCYVNSQQTEDKIHYLEEQLDKLQVTYLEMQNQRDRYIEMLKKNKEEFLQVENCLDELIQMIHFLSEKVMARSTSRKRGNSNSSFMQRPPPPPPLMTEEEESSEPTKHIYSSEEYDLREISREPSSLETQQNIAKQKNVKQRNRKDGRIVSIPKASVSRYEQSQSDMTSNVHVPTTSRPVQKYGKKQQQCDNNYNHRGARVKPSNEKRAMKANNKRNNPSKDNIVQLLKDDALHSRELENLEKYLDQTLSTLRNFPTEDTK